VAVALAWSAAYLLWRVAFTLGGADALTATALLLAEGLAVLLFAVRMRTLGRPAPEVVVSPDAPLPDLSAVVDVAGGSVDELRTTLVALRRVRGIERTILVDRTGADWLPGLAARFGATVLEPTVGFDEAVTGAGTSWVLVMRAGDLPMPDLVTVVAPRCSSPDLAVIQVGVEEADPTSFEHDPRGHWALEPFEQQVVRPRRAAEGALPWFGDGPALVRRSAVAALDRPAQEHMLDDSRAVGLELLRRGYTVTHIPLTLARVPGPRGLRDSLERRHLRSMRALRALARVDPRTLPRSARLAHLEALAPFVSAVQRLLLVAVGVAVLAFGRQPMEASLAVLVVLAVPSYGLRWWSHRIAGRGCLEPFAVLRNDLRSLGVDLTPFGRLRRPSSRGGLTLLVGIVVVLDVAVLVASLAMWRGWTGRPSLSTSAIALLIAVVFLGVASDVVLDAWSRRQRRRNRRVRLGLVTCRLEEVEGQLVDLSTGGAGIVVPDHAELSLVAGDVTTVAFRIPDADGAWRNVSTLVRIAHRHHDPDGGVRFGLAFDDPTDAPLDPVVEFLTIDRRLVALGRHESRR
jgi:hypothetical protein